MNEDLLELKSIIGDKLFHEVVKRFEGNRVYFPKVFSREEIHKMIRVEYHYMIRSKVIDEKDIILSLSKKYGYSLKQIIRIIQRK